MNHQTHLPAAVTFLALVILGARHVARGGFTTVDAEHTCTVALSTGVCGRKGARVVNRRYVCRSCEDAGRDW